MELLDFSTRVGLALLAGLFIGLERELRRKNAGLKTNALVAVGSSVFVLISLQFRADDFVDITRVLGQVVTGIGFIGAGTILQQGKNISGLTTAATIWCSAGAGALAAVAMFKELFVVTLIILLINLGFSYLERKFNWNRSPEDEDLDT